MSPQLSSRYQSPETRDSSHSQPSRSTIEQLPREILTEILNSLNSTTINSNDSSHHLASTLPNDPNAQPPARSTQNTLLACLLASRTLHDAALPLLYQNISPRHHSTVAKLAIQLERYPHLGKLVRNFDVSGLESRNRKGEAKQQEDTAAHLQTCLSRMPQLEELRGPGFCHEELDLFLLTSIVDGEFAAGRLKVLEWGPYITDAMLENIISLPGSFSNSISTLRLRGGDERLTPVVQKLLATMPRLQELDLSHTQVCAEALSGTHSAARLTHLSLKPSENSNSALASLMASHPSIISSLEKLNLEARTFHQSGTQTQDPDDLSNILSLLPSSLKSLNISSSTIHPSNLSELGRLCIHLTELSIGPGLRFRELEQLLIPGLELAEFEEGQEDERGIASKYLPVLSPIADAVAVCQLRRRLNSIPPHCTTNAKKLRYLDIQSMDVEEQRKLKTSVLLGECSPGLEIIEFSESVYLTDERMKRVLGAVGWGLRCRGGRCWTERK